jgi:DNA-binding MarR family transcriptional regulator
MATSGYDGQMGGDVDLARTCATVGEPEEPFDLNWLLHRAAQRIGDAVHTEAVRHGLSMRGLLILTGLISYPGRTQLALGSALGVDKTTLTAELDKLERDGLIVRRPDPQDRRVRIPEVTEQGAARRGLVAEQARRVENDVLSGLSAAEREALRELLGRIVFDKCFDGQKSSGSCM